MKKPLWILLFCVFNYALGYAGNREIDSLNRLLFQHIPDTVYISALDELTWEYLYSDIDSSMRYARLAVSICRQKKIPKFIGTSHHTLATVLLQKGELDSALDEFETAKLIFEKLKMNDKASASYNGIGNVYLYKGIYQKSLENYLHALDLAVGTGNRNKISLITGNIALIYTNMGNYAKSMEYHRKALQIAEETGNAEGMASCYTNIANVFKDMDSISKAEEYHLKALEINTRLHFINRIGENYNNLGLVYKRYNNWKKAREYFEKAIVIYLDMDNKDGLTAAYNNISSIYLSEGKTKEAIMYLDKSLSIAREMNTRERMMNVFGNLHGAYATLNDYKKGYEYLLLYSDLKDSLLGEENSRQIARMQTLYETEKKEKEIEILNRDKKIKEAELIRQRIIIWSVIVGIVLMAGFLILLFNRFYVTRKQKRLIEKQKLMVEEAHAELKQKNRDILDSIEYAKRIQVALLTGKEYLDSHLQEYFIFYRPKDVVSGDFYWGFSSPLSMGESEYEYFYLAAADCTGHGVPGAFMSLLGISFLNEIIIERKILSPDDVLNALRYEIIHSLNPEGREDIQDGMDMVLCRFDFEKMKVEFSGANNRLYLARNGILTEHRGDDMPIGAGMKKAASFSLQTIQLQKGDTVYCTTDGFRDQHGGPKGKKLGSKGLNETFSKICNLPVNEQEKIIGEEFEKWKGFCEQTDDVTVIGIKI